MDHVGWLWGSMDVIVDQNGDYWFLECNPQGQWGWLDREGKITHSKANLLEHLYKNTIS